MHQNSEQPSQTRADWYAVDADDQSALRITPGFTIGEEPSGCLALNDPSTDRQWLEFRVDEEGLWVDIITPDRALVDASGALRRRQLLEHGARLMLPHNTLHVSHDIRPAQRPGPLFELIDRQPQEPSPQSDPQSAQHDPQSPEDQQAPSTSRGPAVLEVVADLRQQLGISAPGEGAPRPVRGTQFDSAHADAETVAAPDRDPVRRPLQRREPLPEGYTDEQPRRHAAEPAEEPPGYRRYVRRRRGNRVRLGPALLGAGILALAAAVVVRGPELVTALEEQARQLTVQQAATPAESTPPIVHDAGLREPADTWSAGPDTLNVHATAPPPGIEKMEPTHTGQPEPQAQASGPTPAAAPSADAPTDASATIAEAAGAATATDAYDQEVAFARALMQEGEITTPPGANAVSVLMGVLEQAPDHPEARALMAQCSDKLVASAVAHHQSGQEYQARNTLEEVLSFAPDHAEANRLWRDWVGAMP